MPVPFGAHFLMLGYPDRSLEEATDAAKAADALGHPLTLTQTLSYCCATVHVFRHEPSAAAAYAERALRICEEQRTRQYHGCALYIIGWALSASGEKEKGLAQIAQGLESYGIGVNRHILLTLQADAQLAIGEPEAALASAASGLKEVEKSEGAPFEAETLAPQGRGIARRRRD